jgi:hypothetical protein
VVTRLPRSGPRAWIVPFLVCACAVVGCGGSGSSGAERTRLIHRLAAQSSSSSLPADLRSCILDKAGTLPLSQLHALAYAGANPAPGIKSVGIQLVTSCIQEGKGLSAVRSLIAQRVAGTMSPNLPAAFRSCVARRAGSLPAAEIAQFISTYETSGASAVRAQGEQVGRGLAIQCLNEPGALASLRTLFLRPLRQLAQSSRFPKSFRECVLHKAEQISSARLKQFALHPQTASIIGRALGESYAHQCLAKGA